MSDFFYGLVLEPKPTTPADGGIVEDLAQRSAIKNVLTCFYKPAKKALADALSLLPSQKDFIS